MGLGLDGADMGTKDMDLLFLYNVAKQAAEAHRKSNSSG
jgi:hypothetical protein